MSEVPTHEVMQPVAAMNMFKRAYLEQNGLRKYRHEESLIHKECGRLGMEVVPFLAKQVQRRQLPLTRECFICGDMDAMHGAMKHLGIEVPIPNDFPKSLEPYFHRRVWRSSVAALESALYDGREVFAKPAGRRKLFTGRVFQSPSDMALLSGVSRQEPLWCSEIVSWKSEFRIYVIGADIVSQDHYAGDASASLSQYSISEAIQRFAASGEAPAAYGIDFGLLDTGETALVEANDGYALGAYSIDAASYARLLFTRWHQLTHS